MEPISNIRAGRTTAQSLRHVIFIGETGSGKSSVINLIADQNRAVVSPDATPCTNAFASYDVSIGGRTFRLWDTPGLNEASRFGRLFGQTGALKRFLQERHRRGELNLLVLCIRGNRACDAMVKVYKTFCCATRQIAPVVIAVTHLERQRPMEAWRQVNERRLGNMGLVFDGHACLTCLSDRRHQPERRASQQDIRILISAEYQPRARPMLSDREYLSDPKSCVVC